MSFHSWSFTTSFTTINRYTNACSMKRLWDQSMEIIHLAKLVGGAAVDADASASMNSRKQVKSVGLHQHSDLQAVSQRHSGEKLLANVNHLLFLISWNGERHFSCAWSPVPLGSHPSVGWEGLKRCGRFACSCKTCTCTENLYIIVRNAHSRLLTMLGLR